MISTTGSAWGSPGYSSTAVWTVRPSTKVEKRHIQHIAGLTITARPSESRTRAEEKTAATAARMAWNRVSAKMQHPAMLEPEVQRFIKAASTADLEAIRELYDVAMAGFSEFPEVTSSYVFREDCDTGKLTLTLRVDTHDMDLDQLIDLELKVRQRATSNPRLKSAGEYLRLAII